MPGQWITIESVPHGHNVLWRVIRWLSEAEWTTLGVYRSKQEAESICQSLCAQTAQDAARGQPTRLHVYGFPPELTEDQLTQLFSHFGTVAQARILKTLEGQSLAFAIVEMSTAAEVEEILHTKDRLQVGGKRLNVWSPSLPNPAQGR